MVEPNNTLPVPDPTELTTEQLRREVAALRDTLETRLDAMDKASDLLRDTFMRAPSEFDKHIEHLRELHDEKFISVDKQIASLTRNSDAHIEAVADAVEIKVASLAAGIDKQFDERDVRSKAAEVAAQVAVNAALQAQKEAAGAQNESNAAAITKSESATVKQIDGILALLASNTKAIDEKISGINARLDRGEGSNTGQNHSQATFLAVGALVISLVVGAVAVYHNVAVNPINVALPSAIQR